MEHCIVPLFFLVIIGYLNMVFIQINHETHPILHNRISTAIDFFTP